MIKEDIKATNELLIEATQVYYDYIEKYSSTWDEIETSISEQTFGQLIFFNYQMKELENVDVEEKNNKAIIIDCLIEITKFSQHINNTLKSFV